MWERVGWHTEMHNNSDAHMLVGVMNNFLNGEQSEWTSAVSMSSRVCTNFHEDINIAACEKSNASKIASLGFPITRHMSFLHATLHVDRIYIHVWCKKDRSFGISNSYFTILLFILEHTLPRGSVLSPLAHIWLSCCELVL